MGRSCYFCGKVPRSGHTVSHANNKTKRIFMPNLQRVRSLVGGAKTRTVKAILVCTRCIRTGLVQKPV